MATVGMEMAGQGAAAGETVDSLQRGALWGHSGPQARVQYAATHPRLAGYPQLHS